MFDGTERVFLFFKDDLVLQSLGSDTLMVLGLKPVLRSRSKLRCIE